LASCRQGYWSCESMIENWRARPLPDCAVKPPLAALCHGMFERRIPPLSVTQET